jgi:Fe-S oxidoreductase
MKRSKANGLCCGAGGAQMFKRCRVRDKEINIERTEMHPETAQIIAAGCPFCNTMMTDGIKNKERESDVKVSDIAGAYCKMLKTCNNEKDYYNLF